MKIQLKEFVDFKNKLYIAVDTSDEKLALECLNANNEFIDIFLSEITNHDVKKHLYYLAIAGALLTGNQNYISQKLFYENQKLYSEIYVFLLISKNFYVNFGEYYNICEKLISKFKM